MRLLHLYLFRNGIRAFPHLIGLRHSACPCCLHAATSFSTFEGSPYRWTCRGVFARLSIGVNLGWESRGARCVERGDITEQGTAVSATGAVSPRSIRGQRLPAQKPCAGRPCKDHRTITNGPPEAGGCCVPSYPAQGRLRRRAASRSYRWRRQRPWDRLLAEATES